ncbi:MAG: PAS domain S-box protein, partial [Salinivirgaceae bacterium]
MNKTKWIVVRQVLRITLIYLSLSIIYILFSDEITNRLLTDPHHIAHVQTYKGLAFIFITSLIIFFLVYHFMLQQAKALNKERESREYFKKVFDNAGTGIAITAWDETFEQCNQVFCQILGYQHEEFSELKLSNLIYSPDKKSFSKLLIQVKEGGSSFCQLETRFMHKSSTVVWVQLYLTTLPNENEESEHLLLLISDVTERKQIEEERKIQNFYLKKAQELGSIGTWHLDIKNNRLTWTEENYKIFGIPRTQVLSYQVFLGAIHPEDRTYVDKKWKEAMEGAPYDLEHRIQVHGKTRWVREKGVVEFDELNKPVGAIGVVQDITQKKQHEAELKAQKDEYYSWCEEYRVINEDLLITKELA